MSPPLRLRVGLWRMLTIPVAFGAILGLCRAARVPANPGLFYAGVGGSALAMISLLARDLGQALAAIGGLTLGVTVGFFLYDPCVPLGLYAGPVVGWVGYRLLLALLGSRTVPPWPEPPAPDSDFLSPSAGGGEAGPIGKMSLIGNMDPDGSPNSTSRLDQDVIL